MSLFYECLLLAAVSLAPIAWYVCRRGADPFNPLVLMGGLGFVVADRRLLLNPGPALSFFSASAYREYVLITVASLLSLYAGWLVWGARNPGAGSALPGQLTGYRRQYDPNRLLVAGLALALLALGAFVVSHGRYRLTGYIRAMMSLNTPAAVLLIQAVVLDGSLALAGIVGICAALTRSVWLFFSYGSRGQTAVVAVLLAVPYLIKETRPRKPFLLAVAAVVGVTMLTLANSREVLNAGEASNRVGAVVVAAENMFSGRRHSYGAGSDTVVGAAQVQAVQALGNWGWGGFLWDVAATFPPHEWFPHKLRWQTPWGMGPGGFLRSLRLGTGLSIPPGVGLPAFSDVFENFWFFFPLFWFALGYLLRHAYGAAVSGRRLNYQGYLVVVFICCLYLVTQGLHPATLDFIFGIFPAMLAYRWCRIDGPGDRVAEAVGRSRVAAW